MKTLFILIILTISINCCSQIISLSYSPQNNDVGLLFISKNKIYSSFEYGNYKILNTKIYKLGLGYSFNLDEDLLLNTVINYNISDTYFKKVSLEFGFTFPIKKTHLTIMYDHILSHFKFGLGYKF